MFTTINLRDKIYNVSLGVLQYSKESDTIMLSIHCKISNDEGVGAVFILDEILMPNRGGEELVFVRRFTGRHELLAAIVRVFMLCMPCVWREESLRYYFVSAVRD